MKSGIICEGGTDLTLIQYFMEHTYDWGHIREKDYDNYSDINSVQGADMLKWFKKDDNYLSILSAGGCTKIPSMFSELIQFNMMAAEPTSEYQNIVMIADNDEISSKEDFLDKITKELLGQKIIPSSPLVCNSWNMVQYVNFIQETKTLNILILIIPFQETGALETFLLDSLSNNDVTDDKVIKQCNTFIDELDTDNKYLKKRRHKTKAKFDVFFSVRTPLEQFQERRTILRSIKWEKYELVQNSFKELSRLG